MTSPWTLNGGLYRGDEPGGQYKETTSSTDAPWYAKIDGKSVGKSSMPLNPPGSSVRRDLVNGLIGPMTFAENVTSI